MMKNEKRLPVVESDQDRLETILDVRSLAAGDPVVTAYLAAHGNTAAVAKLVGKAQRTVQVHILGLRQRFASLGPCHPGHARPA